MTSQNNSNAAGLEGIDGLEGIHDDAGQRCLLYLLGELSAGQATAFEQELESSKRLQDELVSQSNLLCGISSGQPIGVTANLPAAHTNWRLVAVMAALAACLMIAFLMWPRALKNGTTNVADAMPEALLIAQAWADGPLDDLISDWDDDLEADEALLPSAADDSSLSWIVAAAEAGVIIDG